MGVFVNFLTILAFLILNPLIALTCVSVVSLYKKPNHLIFFVSFVVAFTLMFYFRVYGVSWAPDSDDDVISYLNIFNSNDKRNLSDISESFFLDIGNNELLWQLFNWIFINYVSSNNYVYVFFVYLVIFTLIVTSFRLLDEERYIFIIFLYFFFVPASFYSAVHIWRQQIIFSLITIAVCYLFRFNNKKLFFVFLIASVGVHNSTFIYAFIILYLCFLFKKFTSSSLIDHSKIFFIFILSTSAVVLFFKFFSVFITDSIYASGSKYIDTAVNLSFGLIYILYFFLFSSSFLFLKESNELKVFASFFIFPFVFCAITPELGAIYGRMFLFSLPYVVLMVDALIKQYLTTHVMLIVSSLLIIVGFIRIFFDLYNDLDNVLRFLFFGQAKDPFLGIVKAIYLFL